MEDVKLTQKELDELKEHLKYIKEVKGAEISERIKEARSHGDLSENAEYDAAKAEKAANEAEIMELEARISNAKIIDTKTARGVVSLSNIVTIKLVSGPGRDGKFKISNSATPAEAAYRNISEESPVGRALLGKKIGDVVAIKVAKGVAEYKIEKIEQDS